MKYEELSTADLIHELYADTANGWKIRKELKRRLEETHSTRMIHLFMGVISKDSPGLVRNTGKTQNELTMSKVREFIRDYKCGKISDVTIATFIVDEMEWDGVDPSGDMKIAPKKALSILNGLKISDESFTDLGENSYRNLIKMLLDAFYRWCEERYESKE